MSLEELRLRFVVAQQPRSSTGIELICRETLFCRWKDGSESGQKMKCLCHVEANPERISKKVSFHHGKAFEKITKQDMPF